MKAEIHYVTMTDTDRDAINADGWDCEIGQRYHDAQEGVIGLERSDAFHVAAVVDVDRLVGEEREVGHPVESIWVMMQNLDESWTVAQAVDEVKTDFARSMSVGDIIRFDDGKTFRCASAGFEAVLNIIDEALA